MGATDILRTRETQGDASYNGDVFSFVNCFIVRGVKLSMRYNFQRGDSFRKANLDELNRAGGQ